MKIQYIRNTHHKAKRYTHYTDDPHCYMQLYCLLILQSEEIMLFTTNNFFINSYFIIPNQENLNPLQRTQTRLKKIMLKHVLHCYLFTLVTFKFCRLKQNNSTKLFIKLQILQQCTH